MTARLIHERGTRLTELFITCYYSVNSIGNGALTRQVCGTH